MLRCGTPSVPVDAGGLLAIADHPPATFGLRIACAYLSRPGLETLTTAAAGHFDNFVHYGSEWIIGLDNGMTEPRALTTILGIPRARLRLFCPRGALSMAALRSAPRLHAKLLAVSNLRTRVVESVFAGSANFTGAALGPGASNYEVNIYIAENVPAIDSESFNQWWHEIRGQSIPGNPGTVRRYAEFRERYLRTYPDRMDDLESPDEPEISRARFLWIEAGAMSGPPGHRHQIEFAEQLAAFFHAPRRSIDLIVRYRNNPPVNRPLTFRGTTQGQFVDIWRLGLPTPRMGGPLYEGRTILFERLGPLEFRVEVDDAAGRLARSWMRGANRGGYVGRTGATASISRRQYGYFGQTD
jgi:hypothetical protein